MLYNKIYVSLMDQETRCIYKVEDTTMKYLMSYINLQMKIMKLSIWHLNLPIL